jgi:hypothetical protein
MLKCTSSDEEKAEIRRIVRATPAEALERVAAMWAAADDERRRERARHRVNAVGGLTQ